ncbi:hypothetical protein BB559_000802 [Furculomyces boomerangus]|uniref:60S ribosomal protein L35 n=2 Tax=Harpellales TaxID=61421 RepID=A0A2T9Z401_9FUNG|nr:hypothetical protein BB559_000802 [Furculomyces boomerangus]
MKKDLVSLKVQQVAGSASASGYKVREMRKDVARVLTVITQQDRKKALEASKGKRTPLDLRNKKTRAIRRALKRSERTKVTLRKQKKNTHFSQRQYAVKA